MKERYDKSNLHIAYSKGIGFVYDVPTNTIFKVSTNIAKEMYTMQGKDDKDLEVILNNKLRNKGITILKHNYWWETKSITQLVFNVTSQCNLRCKYCYASYGVYSGYSLTNMKPDDAIRYIENLIEMGIDNIEKIKFFGGEPLLAIDTIEAICCYFMKLYKKKIINSIPIFSMVTNLVRCDKKISDVIVKYNIKLIVSLDGTKEIHDSQRVFPDGTGSYQFVNKNIQQLKQQLVAIEATYTINHLKKGISIKKLQQYLANKYDLSENSIIAVPVSGVPELEVPFSDRKLDKEDLVRAEDINILVAYYPEKQTDLFCNAGYTSLCIMPNGDIYPCHLYAVERKYSLGNIDNIHNLEKYKEKLQMLPLGSKTSNTKCQECWARKICFLCPAQTILLEDQGSIFSNDYCNRRKTHYEKVLFRTICDSPENH